jgi:hypothetical protein
MKARVQPARPRKGPAQAEWPRAVEAQALEAEKLKAAARPTRAPVLRAARQAQARPRSTAESREEQAIPR